jgi:chitinase
MATFGSMVRLPLCVVSLILLAQPVGCGSAKPDTSSSTLDGGVDAPSAGDTGARLDEAGQTGVSDAASAEATSSTLEGGQGADGSETGDAGGSASTAWIMGYYASWDELANGGFYDISSIDWDALTHVATAFYIPDGNGGWTSDSFDATTALAIIDAAHAHGKKALASIGGSGSGAAFEGSTEAANVAAFLTSLQALITMGYDGLDIDWEGGSLTVAQDQALETSLIGSLRSKNPGAILTMTAGYENENLLDDLSFYGTIVAQLDRLNLMTYGMSGAYSGWESWHSSPLHWNMNSSTPTGIDISVTNYLNAGVPSAKLGVGAGFYGECYTAPVTAPVQSMGASQVPASDGTMSYRNIMASYYSSADYHYDSAADVPYLTLSGSNAEKCTYVTYEDATSIAAKASWVKAQGLGGIIIWTMSEGYVASLGTTVAAQNPLLEVMKTSLSE